MKLTRILVLVALAASLATTASPAQSRDREIEEGCYERSWGYRCWFGPYDIAPEDDAIPNQISLVPAIPEAGYITSMKATLVDPFNVQLDHHAAHLHHIVFGNPNREDLTCGDTSFFSQIDRFFATGKERTPLLLPEAYGYHWDNSVPPDSFWGPKDEPAWVMIRHLHTMIDGYTQKDAYVRFDLGFVPEGDAEMTDVTPVWLDVRNCGTSEFTVLKGSGTDGVHIEPWDYQMPISGRFVAMGGHLHDGGLKLRLDNTSTSQKLFVSRAGYAEKPRWDLKSMTTYASATGRLVNQGDMLRLRAYYNSTRKWENVMGIMQAYIVPEAGD
jgi:hypothetical protein